MTKHFYTWFTCCLFALMTVLPLNAQNDCVIVGTGTATSSWYLPISPYYHNSYMQQLYLASEINHVAADISSIAFAYDYSESVTRTISVYMAHTDVTSLSSGFVTADLEEVLSPTVFTFDNSSDWTTIELSTPFAYDGSSNLVVAVYMNYSSAETSYSGGYRFLQTSSTGMARYVTNDTSSPNQISLTNYAPTASGSTVGYRANTQFCFAASGSCAKPKKITLGDVTTTTATFTWTASDDAETSWTVLVKNGNNVLVNNTTVNTPSYTITGLTAATTYSFSVEVTHACDGDATGVAKGSLYFTTACNPVASLPWSEDFENVANTGSGKIPTCWAYPLTGSTYPYVYSSSYSSYAGTYCLYFYGGVNYYSTNSEQMVALPEISADLSNARIRFYYKSSVDYSSYVYGNLVVGAMTDPTDASTFVAIETLPQKSSYTLAEIPLRMNGARYIAFRYEGGEDAGSAYIDNIIVDELPTCWPPLSVDVESVTKTSALIAWHDTAAVANYQVLIKNGETELVNTLVEGDTTVLISGLTHSTSYKNLAVTITKVCSESDSSEPFSGKVSFNTACEIKTFATDTLILGFEEYASSESLYNLPCWDTLSYKSTAVWYTSSTSHSGSKGAYIYNIGTGKYSVLVSPQIELPGDGYELLAYVKESSHYDADSVYFYVNDEPTLEGATLLGNISEMSTSWKEFRQPLGVSGNVYVLVQAFTASYGYIYLDDLTFQPAPNCLPASNLKRDSLSSHAVRFSWTPGADEESWLIDIKGKVIEVEEEEVSEPFYLIEELDPLFYDSVVVKVTAVCDEDNHSTEILTGVFEFRTPAEPTELPFATDFEDEDDNLNWETANASTNKWYTGSAVHSGSGEGSSMYISNDGGESNAYTTGTAQFSWIYRSFNFDEAGDYDVTFDWRAAGENFQGSICDGMVAVIVPGSVTPQAANTTSCELGEISSFSISSASTATQKGYIVLMNGTSMTFGQQSAWQLSQKFAITIPQAGVYKLCFGWVNDSSSGSNPAAAVDNVSISKLACAATPEPAISSIGTDSVIIAWGNKHDAYSVLVKKGSDTLFINAAYEDHSVILRNLTPATKYTVSVRLFGICDEQNSDTITNSMTFTTDCLPKTAPWSENFDNLTSGIPSCWNNDEGTTTNEEYKWNASSNGRTGKSLRFNSYSNSSGNTNILSTPVVIIPDKPAEFIFWCKNPTGGDFSVSMSVDGAEKVDVFEDLTGISTWTEKKVDLTAHAGKSVQFFFNATSNWGSGQAYMDIDDIKLRAIPTCLPTESATIADTTTNSITLSWRASSTNGDYAVLFAKGADTLANALTPDTFLVVNNLEAGHEYNGYTLSITTVCSATDSSEVFTKSLSFTTDCEAINSLPWREFFEDASTGSGKIPACWTYTKAYTSSTPTKFPYVLNSSSSAYEGSNSLYFYGGASSSKQIVAMPEMTAGWSNARIRFYYKNGGTGSSYAKFILGAMTDPTNEATFVPVDTLAKVSSYTLYEKNLTNVGDTCHYLAIKYEGGSSSNGAYIDRIIVDEIPTCFPASNLHAIDTLATTSSVSFGWSPNSDETSWHVIVKNGTTVVKDEVATDTIYTVDGLASSKSYTFNVSVAVVCGEVESEAIEANLSLATLCEKISTLPWSENFNDLTSGIPACWDNTEGTTTTASYKWNYYATGHDGAGLRFNSYNNSEDKTNTLATPEIQLPAAPAELVFWCKNPTGGNFDVKIAAVGGSRQVLFSGLTGISDWTEKTADLTDFAGQTIQFFFEGTSNYGSGDAYLYLDDVEIHLLPACQKPSAVEKVLTTATSASFTWTGNADNYSVEIFNGATRLDSIVVAADALPFVIDTLQPNTSYAFRFNVFGLCGGEDGNSEARSTLLSVKTQCETVAAPWSEDFNDLEAGIPECWDNSEGGATNKWAYHATGHTEACVRFDSYNNSEGATNTLATPMIALPAQPMQLVFWCKNPTGGDYSVSLVDGQGVKHVLLTDLTAISDWTEQTVLLNEYAGQIVQLLFKGVSNWAYGDAYLYLDDISIEPAPSCFIVKNIAKGAVTANEASFTWESQGSEEAWKVVITDLLNNNVELFNATVSSPVATINGLTANTKYSVRVSVKAVCGEEEESDAVTADFTFRTDVSADMVEAIGAGASFEADFSSEDERGRWLFAGEDETNHFIFGTAAAALRGSATHGLYITNNDAAWAYSNTKSASMAWRIFSIADDGVENNDSIRVEFEWQANGEEKWDFARAFIVGSNAAFEVADHTAKVAGVAFSSSNSKTELPNVINLHQDEVVELSTVTTWQSLNETVLLPAAGQYKLLFVWQNDAWSDYQYPFAVGNVKITNLQGTGQGTSVNTVENGVQVVKFINNGRVYILRDGVVYDILGTTVR